MKIQANNIPRPPRNSGLNPSGVPYDSQINRPSEIIQSPTFVSSTPSYPSFDSVPDLNINSTNSSTASVYNFSATQDDSVGVGEYPTLHYNYETFSSTVDNPQRDTGPTLPSWADAGHGQRLSLDEPGVFGLSLRS